MSSTTPSNITSAVQFQRSITEGTTPFPDKIEEGEIGLNLRDLVIFSKDDDGKVVKVGGNYDAVLLAHFQASNPHGTTKGDLGLGEVPNVNCVPVIILNPPENLALNLSRLKTQIEKWDPNITTLTVENTNYAVGDTIEVYRHMATTGRINIELDSGQFYVRGIDSGTHMHMDGDDPFKVELMKIDAQRWRAVFIKI